MSGERILVADDRRENLLFLANSVLRPEGYEVITAIDGKQALDKAIEERPDLIITDLKMPRLSGLELMTALRKAGLDIPVILTTFYGSEQAAIQAFRLGARDYIVKPYEVQEMLASVERALAERHLQRGTADLREKPDVTQHLEERVRQLHSLCNIGRALTALHSLEEVMRVTVEAAIHLTDAGSGQFFLADPDSGQLELRTVREPSDARTQVVRRPGSDTLAQQAASTGRTAIAERNTGAREQMARLAVPLREGEKVTGVLAVEANDEHGLSENDRYLLGLLAGFAGVALTNAHLFERLQAATPPLGPAPGTEADGPVPELAASVAEAQRLSSELRDLAAAAQVLATRLQAQSESREGQEL
jgi:two-component system, NtrC family, sensor kinase